MFGIAVTMFGIAVNTSVHVLVCQEIVELPFKVSIVIRIITV
jgi:hypothetical protein